MEESLNDLLDLMKKNHKPRDSVKSTKSTEQIEQQPKELNNSNHRSEPVTIVPDSNTSVQTSGYTTIYSWNLIKKVLAWEKLKAT